MRVGVDCGHTLNGADYGAVGIKAESNLTREVGVRVINKLKSKGVEAISCYKDTCSSLDDSLSYRTNTANKNNLDLFISIHFNCFNGNANGTEIFTYGGKVYSQASNILNNLVALGFTNRGIKNGSDLYVIRNTNCEAMLVEVCFCDNKHDMDIYNAETISDAIVSGILGNKNVEKPKTQRQYRNVVVYAKEKEADKCIANILSWYLEDCICLPHTQYNQGIGKSVYSVGALTGIKADVVLRGQSRKDTLDLVLKRIGKLA